MAVASYGSTNISMNGVDIWHNDIGASGVSFNTLFTGLTPADSQPHQASELRNNAFLYGSVQAGTGGTVSVTSGYSQGAATSFNLENVNFNSISSITITATATYPYTFHSFRDSSGGGGSALSTTGAGTTTGTITLTSSTHTSVQVFHAHFTTTHSSP